MGRKSYELAQSMGDNPMPGFPSLKEYVFSTTLKEVKPGVVLIKEDIASTVEKIKKEKGKDIWLFGGAGLTASLLAHHLVDEIGLAVHPVLLGSGKPHFSGIKERRQLRLVDSKTYTTGLVFLTYTFND